MSLSELEEILRAADAEPEKTTSDRKVIAKVGSLLLSPVEAALAQVGGFETEFLGGVAGKKSQFIAEYRCAVPEREELVAPLRIALGSRKKTTNDANYFMGVTVAQKWEEARSGEMIIHPSHIRWGLWSHTPAVKDRITGPFRGIAKNSGRSIAPLPSHRVANMKSFWLSMLGTKVTVDDLSKFDSIEDLIQTVAADLFAIAGTMKQPPPPPEDDEGAESDAEPA